MALQKEIIQEDGVLTKYHRILFIQQTVNRQTAIAVLSYTDNNARENEKDNIFTTPYRKSVTYEIPYDEKMTVEAAYEHLKTLPPFEGAVDV